MDQIRQLLGIIEPEFDLSSPLNFLTSVYKSSDLPMHVRLRVASEACKYSMPQLKAVAHVNNKDSLAVSLDRARARSNLVKVVKLEIVPAAQKALPPSQHDASELKPNPTSAANGDQSSSGAFRRRI
jgi:hypothetical protein